MPISTWKSPDSFDPAILLDQMIWPKSHPKVVRLLALVDLSIFNLVYLMEIIEGTHQPTTDPLQELVIIMNHVEGLSTR